MRLIRGDCLVILKTLSAASVDSVVTDPPAGIAFMGKDWDSDKGGRAGWVAWMTEVMAECLRVLKPGGHALAWSIPRTSHWTATALEDAGFEIRDCVTHLFGSGFPKSKNCGNGFGTALKPAAEFWWLCRKPCSEKTVAANVLKWGTGAINVDGCRIGTGDDRTAGGNSGVSLTYGQAHESGLSRPTGGRFPANLVLSHNDDCDDVCTEGCAVAMLDGQSGMRPGDSPNRKPRKNSAEAHNRTQSMGKSTADWETAGHSDSGGASRFFYCAKASKSDRNRKVNLEQASDCEAHEADGLFDSAGNPTGRRGA